MKVIRHQDERKDSQIKRVSDKMQLAFHDLPNLGHRKFKPFSIDASSSNVEGIRKVVL
jgi:hypothetical protein